MWVSVQYQTVAVDEAAAGLGIDVCPHGSSQGQVNHILSGDDTWALACHTLIN